MKHLRKLTDAEIEHRDHPERQKSLYGNFKIVNYYRNQAVYLFSWSSPRLTQDKHTLNLSNAISDTVTLKFRQHSRYSVVPLHVRDYIEINYVLEGEVDEFIEGQIYHPQKGDLCFVDTNTIHTILKTNESDIIIDILIKKQYFTSYFLDRIPNHGSLPSFIMSCISTENNDVNYLIIRHSTHIRPIINNILEEQISAKEGSKYVMESLLLMFFIYLTREKDFLVHSSANLTQDIEAYIQANFRNTSLTKAAEHFSFQKNYFSALVKKKTGKNFSELVKEKQMDTAISYLHKTDWSIAQIISEIGCSNTTYFYQTFKSTYGVTPAQYRKQYGLK